MAIEKTDAEAFCNDTQQEGFIRKILQRNNQTKNEHVCRCLCTEKKFFYQNERGEGSSTTFLLPKLMNILSFSYCICFAFYLSTYSDI